MDSIIKEVTSRLSQEDGRAVEGRRENVAFQAEGETPAKSRHFQGAGMVQLVKEHYGKGAPHERKEGKRKQEDLPEDQHLPRGQRLQKGERAQSTEDKTKETGEDRAAEEGPSLSKTEPRKDAKDWKLPMPLGPDYPPLISSNLSTTRAVGRNWKLSPPVAKSFRIHDAHMAGLPQQGPFRHFMDMKVEKRLASWKERRSHFGDVSMHKCYRFGQVFSPFQALSTVEMQRLVFPRDPPMSTHIQRMGTLCPTDVNLQDLSLFSTELGLGKDDSNHEKEKPVSHVKTPLFPPIVKATKSNDIK
ncbi:PREDICTED: uncharacterized protein LOC103603259 [Galeopterus variegatus]|uniref:Uncharacterized protein LOC103603259 n=1 Tax=Galeopterus variegatus TaxID=482537 RepID=A0ABM0RZD2_GALVR|nr:PREDICTED: uncharacterized protein LOC103603259 [Galeopterus variegatus]